MIFVIVPPPIRGLGQAGGFQMMVEDRRSLGLERLAENRSRKSFRRGDSQSGLRNLNTTFSARSPQLYLDIDRTKAQSLQVPLNNVFGTLQAYLGSTYVNLFNKFNQVFQVYVQADAPFPPALRRTLTTSTCATPRAKWCPWATFMSVKQTLGSELVTRYNLYPAAPIFGSPRPRVQFRAGPEPDGAGGGEYPAPRAWPMTGRPRPTRRNRSAIQAYFIYALSITLVFMVLAALYESWTSPAAVILVVPMAMVGVLLALIIRGYGQ